MVTFSQIMGEEKSPIKSDSIFSQIMGIQQEEDIDTSKIKEEDLSIPEEIFRTAMGAVRDVSQGTLDLSRFIESKTFEKLPANFQGGIVVDEDGARFAWGEEYLQARKKRESEGKRSIELPRVEEPTYWGGSVIRDIGGFAIPITRVNKALTLAGVAPKTMAGKIAKGTATGVVAEQMAFSPYESRLSTLATEYGPEFIKPVAEFLQADPEDTEAQARLKMALEGAGLGAFFETVISAGAKAAGRFVPKKQEPTGFKKYVQKEQDIIAEAQVQASARREVDDLIGGIERDVDIATRSGAETSDNIFQRAANRAIEFVGNKFFPWYGPLKNLPGKKRYLMLRYRTLGRLGEVEKFAKNIFKTFGRATETDKQAAFKYLTSRDKKEIIEGFNAIKSSDVKRQAKNLKKDFSRVGRELVDKGILDPQAFKANEYSYLPRIYLRHLDTTKPFDYAKARKLLTDKERKILGEITDPAFLGYSGINRELRDLTTLELFSAIAKDSDWAFQPSLMSFGRYKNVTPFYLKQEADWIKKYHKGDAELIKEADDMIKAADEHIDINNLQGKKIGDYKKLPDTLKYGNLRGMFVRKEIYDDLVGTYNMLEDESFAAKLLGPEGWATKGTKIWKMSKVALNPPTQIRNFISNMVLLNLSGVPMTRVFPRVIEAWTDIVKGGPYSQIARKWGVNNTTFARHEMIEINRALLKARAAKGNWFDKAKSIGSIIPEGATWSYQFMEVLGKTAKLIDEMKQGVNEANAAMSAQKTLFDYSLVPKSVRYLRNAPIGVPFMTFYYKVLPNLLETMIKRPSKMLPYIMIPTAMHTYIAKNYDVDYSDVEKLKESLPEWLRRRNNALIMPVKDKHGRWQPMDYSFFLPWGMYQQLVTDTTDAQLRDALSTSGVLGGPVPQMITAIQSNIDPFTQKEIVKSEDPPERQVADMFNYLWRMSAPTWVTDIGFAGKLLQKIRGEVDIYGDPRLSETQTALRLVGVNLYPVDPKKSRATNLRMMKREIDETKTRAKQIIKDRNLTEEEREKLKKQYKDRIDARIKQFYEYKKGSEVPSQLLEEQPDLLMEFFKGKKNIKQNNIIKEKSVFEEIMGVQ